MTTETKPIKTINFIRHITKKYDENYSMSYDEFAAHLRKEGWNNKEFKDDEPIKKMWDELVESGDNTGDGEVIVDTEIELDNDHFDEEEWDDGEEDVWDYIENTNIDDVLSPCVVEGCSKIVIYEGEKCWSCEILAKKTSEQKAIEEKEKAESEAKMNEWIAKRNADMKKAEDEWKAKRKTEQTDNAPKNILNAISAAADIFKVEPTTEEDEQWKIKAMRSVARLRILDQMKSLVAQLEEVGKW
jgi:hypothetical protein